MASVLVAEDEFLIRSVLADALGEMGMTCIEAPTGQVALDIVTGSTALAAIIVDIGLPDISGEKVIEAAVAHRPGTPVIRCSGASDTAPVAGQKIHVFPKPYSAIELSKFLASLISQSRP